MTSQVWRSCVAHNLGEQGQVGITIRKGVRTDERRSNPASWCDDNVHLLKNLLHRIHKTGTYTLGFNILLWSESTTKRKVDAYFKAIIFSVLFIITFQSCIHL